MTKELQVPLYIPFMLSSAPKVVLTSYMLLVMMSSITVKEKCLGKIESSPMCGTAQQSFLLTIKCNILEFDLVS